MLLLLLACGGSTELQKPHDPPVWPMENLVVDTPGADAAEPPPAPEPEPEPPRDDMDANSPTEAP